MFLILFKILQLLLKGKSYLYYHFTDNETEAQRGYGTRLGESCGDMERGRRDLGYSSAEVQVKIFDSERRDSARIKRANSGRAEKAP